MTRANPGRWKRLAGEHRNGWFRYSLSNIAGGRDLMKGPMIAVAKTVTRIPSPWPSRFIRQPTRALPRNGAPSSSRCGVGEPPQLGGPGVAVQTRHHIEHWIKGHWGVSTAVGCWQDIQPAEGGPRSPEARKDKLKLKAVIVDRQRRQQEWTHRSLVRDETAVDRSSMPGRPQEEATQTASASGG